MQKFLVAPDGRWGNECIKKGTILAKRRDLLSLQTERTFFYPAASNVACLFWASHAGCLPFTSQHAEANNMKAPLDVITLNLELITPRDD